MQLSAISLGIGRLGGVPFSPAALFGSGEAGVWFDASDISTMWQDSGGTSPVTAMEQPVGRWVSKVNGHVASQSTAASRPVVSSRVNLLTYTEEFDNAAWTPFRISMSPNTTVAPDGTTTADSFVTTAATSTFVLQNTTAVATAVGRSSTFSFCAKKGAYDWVYVDLYDGTFPYAYFDLNNGVVGSKSAGVTSSITSLGNGWHRCTITATAGGTTMYTRIFATITDQAKSEPTITSTGVTAHYLWGADLRPTSDINAGPAYQRVVTSTDYTATGFNQYEQLDGVDDSWAQSADGGSTAGFYLCSAITVRGGAGAARTIWSDAGTNTGYRVRVNASNQLELAAGNGTAYTTVNTTATLPVGETHIVTAWDDGVNLNVQIDGGAVASTARPTVSAGSSTATIGKDNGAASSFFNGRVFGLIYRTTAPTEAQRGQTRSWLAARCGVTL